MIEGSEKHYSIDTSSLITWWDETYSPDIFESLPDRLAKLIEDGRLRAVHSVRDEIKDSNKQDTLAKWCKGQKGFYFDEDEAVQCGVKEILGQFQNPKKVKGIGGADPFVIAFAKVQGDNWCVVTEENQANGNAHKTRTSPLFAAASGCSA